MLGVVEDLGYFSSFNYPAEVHYGNRIGHIFDDRQIMRYEKIRERQLHLQFL